VAEPQIENMKKETIRKFDAAVQLSRPVLRQLAAKGYRYVQVKAFTRDMRQDYIDPRFILLMPLRELPGEPARKDIYEPINSEMLKDWADLPGVGVEVLVTGIL